MWKTYINNYSVHSSDLIRNEKTGRTLKPSLNSKGYLRVRINNKTVFIHRAVAQVFVANPDNLSQVNHKDYNKLNNDHDNLEWCNNSKNQLHSYELGRFPGRAKLSKTDVYNILIILGKKLKTPTELALDYNVAVTTIYALRQGRNMKRFK